MRVKNVASAFLAVLIGATFGAAVRPSEASAGKTHLVARALPDCEDTDVLRGKCVTFDEGAWFVVSSYHPYRSARVHVCSLPFGKKIPCVIPNRTKGGKYYVVSRMR